ncbi:MAG: class B sortase [Actinomycetes bacterium]|jgi:LPXTG-site transpeptidase (sortase) family protein|nr:class B sortase [Actinomycetes bacterium]
MSKFVRGLVIVLAVGMMAFAGYQLGNIAYDYIADDAVYEELRADADSPEDPNDTTPVTNEDEEGGAADVQDADGELVNPDAQFSVANYLKRLFGKAKPKAIPISGNQTSSSLKKAQTRKINFKKLKKKNKQIVAWLTIPNTKIDYPITKAKNNSYYLKRNALKKKSSAGSIFLDAKANASFNGQDSPVYGHHMRDKSMFGSLGDLRRSKFRKKHQYVYVYTAKDTKKYKISSQFITKKKKLAPNKSKTKVVTLVTCEYTSKNAHYVVRAKLQTTKKPGKK